MSIEVSIGPVRVGGGAPLAVIAGPCVIESRESALRHGERLASLAADLDRILQHFRKLDEVDVEGVPPTAHPCPQDTPLREDEPAACLSREQALRNAPKAGDGHFAVPPVLPGGGDA